MKQMLVILSIILALTGCRKAPETMAMELFTSLEGNWQGEAEYIIEEWVRVSNTHMQATVKNTDNEPPSINEIIDIKSAGDDVIYEGTLYDRTQKMAITFHLESADKDYVRLENITKQFPQHLEYWLIDEQTLVGRISGTQNAKTVTKDFKYTRLK